VRFALTTDRGETAAARQRTDRCHALRACCRARSLSRLSRRLRAFLFTLTLSCCPIAPTVYQRQRRGVNSEVRITNGFLLRQSRWGSLALDVS